MQLFKAITKYLKMTMDYKEVIAQSMQKNAPAAINMHRIEQHYIMDIDYTVIINSIVEDLKSNGYEIVNTNP